MPTFTYSEGFWLRPASVFNYFDGLYATAEFVSGSATTVTMTYGSLTATITGSDLTTGDLDGRTVLTGGTIDHINFNLRSGYDIDIGDLSMDAAWLFGLATDPDHSALEQALMLLNWTVTGNSHSDALTNTERTNDKTKVHFRGDDVFDTGYGVDRIWAGAGDDTIFGGLSDDVLQGATGSDLVYGGSGWDIVSGGIGRDRVYGGGGNDIVHGNEGRDIVRGGGRDDTVTGGTGKDVLFGGSGVDTFRFILDDGNDVIRDYEVGEQIELQGITDHTVSETVDGDVLISWSGGSVVLQGVAYADFDQGDIVV